MLWLSEFPYIGMCVYTTYKGDEKTSKKQVELTFFLWLLMFLWLQYACEWSWEGRIFQAFYSLSSHDAQNKYLYGLIGTTHIKRCTTRQRRNYSTLYHVLLANGSHQQVCKKMFCDLHAIEKRHVEILVNKIICGILIANDKRGRHTNRPNTLSEQANLRRKFVSIQNRFPVRQAIILTRPIWNENTLTKVLVFL